MAFIYGMTAYT